MALSGLHLLLTYRCTRECDHCFVWGSPQATGAMELERVRQLIAVGKQLSTVRWVYFEGGEPFLYFPVMLQGVEMATALGFGAGIVSNGYWATSSEDARSWLEPLARAGLSDLSLSTDVFHGEGIEARQVANAVTAARELGIPTTTLTLATPPHLGQGRRSGGQVHYRGRAAAKLTPGTPTRPWEGFGRCPYENLANPSRVHIDPGGYVHLCQGLALGNAWEEPLSKLIADYKPQGHPVVGPLLNGGPAELVRVYGLPHEASYVDACHLCYEARSALRERFPQFLAPGQVYGEVGLVA